MLSSNGQALLVAYPHRPMTLHSPTENSLAVLNDKILEANSQGPKREIRRSPNVSFNKSIVARAVWTCCAVLLEPQLLDIMIVQFRMKKLVIMALYRSPLTITLWPSSFLKKDSTSQRKAHQKKAKQSVFLDVTVFRHTLVD
ncbi:hypothetical protein TNCV_3807351 [Trichonephila clavipes]|nr:hypothetical protein TNCV_3807351 [Trichonephila clavipes]